MFDMKKWLLIVGVAAVLAGCEHITKTERPPITELPPKQQPVVTPPPLVEAEPVPPPTEVVPPPPKVVTYNWSAAIAPLVDKMAAAVTVDGGNLLLPDQVKNSTNGGISTQQATHTLYQALANQTKFNVIAEKTVMQARQALGISAEDSLASRSKAVGLARYLQAQYVLYTQLKGHTASPEVIMQLLLVQSGELLWSGSSAVEQQQ